jgi:uncharacterized membrane protein
MRINRLPLISQTILFTSHTTNNAPFFVTAPYKSMEQRVMRHVTNVASLASHLTKSVLITAHNVIITPIRRIPTKGSCHANGNVVVTR